MPSQHDEDKIIFELTKNIERGYYVDVGANEPWSLSNTAALYNRGWNGVLIEPLPDYTNMLRQARPRDIVVQAGCYNCTTNKKIYIQEGLSSLLDEWNDHRGTPTMDIRLDTLSNILSEYPEVRDNCYICCIDVEGVEKEVLEGIDFTTFSPQIFVIEYITFLQGIDKSPLWEGILFDNNYEVHTQNQLNKFYVKKNL